MGRAEEIFKRLKQEGESALDELLRSRETDQLYLDFQRPSNDGQGAALHDNDRTFLSTAISAFANTEGGIVVWGVDVREDFAKYPIESVSRFARWLDNIVSGLTMPAYQKIQNHPIRLGAGSGFVLTLIPKTPLAPHQAISDQRYYMRLGANSVPVPHNILVRMFNQQQNAADDSGQARPPTQGKFRVFKQIWFWWLDLPTQTKVAVIGGFIAMCSLFLTVDQARELRRHQRLSVKPSIIVSFLWSDEGAGWLTGNQGIGPAEVRWFGVFVDGNPQPSWRAMVERLGGLPSGSRITHQLVYGPGQLVPARPDAGRLFWMTGGAAKPFLKSHRSRVTIRVCFCSLYGECWESSDRLSVSDTASWPGPLKESSCNDPPPTIFRVTD